MAEKNDRIGASGADTTAELKEAAAAEKDAASAEGAASGKDTVAGNGSAKTTGAGTDAMKLPKPTVEIIVDGKTIEKPGMKTIVMSNDSIVGGSADDAVLNSYGYSSGTTVCTCDTVAVPVPEGSSSSGSGGGTSIPGGGSSGGGGYCTCNKVCTCIPVT